MTKIKCLSATALRLFNDGQLPERDIALIGQHLDECHDCLQLLESLQPGPLESGLKNSVVKQRPEGDSASELDSRAKMILDRVQIDEPPADGSHFGRDLYQLKRLLRETQYGQIFLANDLVMQRPCTVIVPNSALIASIDHRAQFIHDAQVASCLRHENIIRVFQYGSWNQRKCYLAMPEIKDCSLQRILESDQRLNLPAILTLLGQICQALIYAHRHQVIHRHLNPQIVFVGEDWTVQISEFGLTFDGRYQFELIEPLVDATRYNSPESIRNVPQQIDIRTDIFSTGAILHAMLKKSDIEEDNQRALQEIGRKCRRASRRNRYQSVEELVDDIGRQVQCPLGQS